MCTVGAVEKSRSDKILAKLVMGNPDEITIAGVRIRKAVGLPGYWVSEHGEVWSTKIHQGSAGGRRMQLRTDSHGLPLVNLRGPAHEQITKVVSHLVTEAFIGPKPSGLEVCHYDGNPANNNICNLRYDTHAANGQDTIRYRKERRA